jgi:hypothetical protein
MSSTTGDVINQSTTRNVTNNSTTGYVVNHTDVKLTFRPGSVSHGNDPTIETQSLDPGNSATVFIALSDGAGVEGNVMGAGAGVTFDLYYDNPVVGPNSGKVTSDNPNYSGICDVGSGDNNTIKYTLQGKAPPV